jgi:putative flippase GtrA
VTALATRAKRQLLGKQLLRNRKLPGRRQLLFVSVGASCFGVQYAALTAMAAAGVNRPLANALGFVLSAQLNFVLSSRLTWRDRRARTTRTLWARLISYNGTALISLAVNTAVFSLVYQRVGNLAGAAAGVISGMCVTYLVCDLLIFRDHRSARSQAGGLSAALTVPPAGTGFEPEMSQVMGNGSGQVSGNGSGQVVTNGSGPRRPAALAPWPPAMYAPANGNGAAHDGVAVIMPAYGEERNLASTVTDFLRVLELDGVPHCVVVVNDGSPDRTGEVAERLAAEHPGRVLVVHHDVNRGYGAAVATGIKTGLELNGHRWLFLTDSDGQFEAAELPSFLAAARLERADAVVGYRTQRADPWYRRLNGSLWTAASRILLRVGIRDVDCAYKLIERRSMQGLVLKGEAATISPELIAKLRLREARIIERPVEHFPRQYGEQTGARLSVVLRSMLGLLGLTLEIAAQRRSGRLLQRLVHPKDAVLAVTTLAAVGASVGGYLYFLHRGVTLAYPDAISHLLIARRVLDSPTAGAAQLGAVWLPLPHLLSLPFIWVNAWYYSGFAGSLISMTAYVMTVRYAYRTAARLTRRRAGGVVAAVTFGANPNVLYLQSTPMTELLLIACTAATVYYLMRWCQTGRYVHLAATAAAALLASLTRYEGWVLCLTVAGIVVYVAWRRAGSAGSGQLLADDRGGRPKRGLWSRLRAVEANLIFYGCLGLSGIAGWVLWNAVIFRDPLYFQTGPYAKPSLWVSHSEKAIGHWGVSAMTYLYAMADNAGVLVLALSAVGFAYYLARTRLRTDTIAPLALTAFVPFYVYALHSGQRPLHVTQISGSLYNVRFGLLMVLPAAIFMSFLVTAVTDGTSRTWLRRGAFAVLVLAGAAGALLVARGGVDTLTEAVTFRAAPAEQANAAAAAWLRSHYSGGKVLMESFGNETVTFGSRILLGEIVYEGSFRQWEPDLAHPGSHGIRWIYMRQTPGGQDQVYRQLHGSAQLAGYRLVYHDAARLIYERRSYERPAVTGSFSFLPRPPRGPRPSVRRHHSRHHGHRYPSRRGGAQV